MAARWVEIRNTTQRVSLADRAELADTMWKRGWGLIPYRSLASGSGMVLTRTGSIHTSFLRFSIDVLFLDQSGRIVGWRQSVRPFRVALAPRGTRTAIELPAGTIQQSGSARGDSVTIQPVA